VRAALLASYVLSALALGLAYPAIARGPELLSATFQHPWFLLLFLPAPWLLLPATFG